jgi:SAM-dependent methyltransferase
MSPEMPGAENYYRWVVDAIQPHLGEQVLDVGGGYGTHLEPILQSGRSVVSLDISPESVALMRVRFEGRPRFEALCGDLGQEELIRTLEGRRFDTVIALNVLEHIDDDLATLRAMRRIVAPERGRVVLQLPAHRWLYGHLDAMAGHRRRYTRRSIRDRLLEAGLEVVMVRHFNRFGVLPWWINGRLRPKLDSAVVGAQVRLFDRYFVPVSRLLDAVAPLPVGQSLIAVGTI